MEKGIEGFNQRIELKANSKDIEPTIMDMIVAYDQGDIDVIEQVEKSGKVSSSIEGQKQTSLE